MKLSALVNSVKDRFPILLTSDKAVIAYLKQALTAYQDLAGYMKTVKINFVAGGLVNAPIDFLSHVVCKSDSGDFVQVSVTEDDHCNHVLSSAVAGLHDYTYFVKLSVLADRDIEETYVSDRIAGRIADYLECLVGIDNDERIARTETAAKMDTSRIQTASDRKADKSNLEEQFKANREIMPLFSIY